MKETSGQSVLTSYSTTSIAHLYGNVTSLARDYFIRLFPKNYIKTVHINTVDLSEELEEVDTIRKEKPILIIKPEFNLEMDSTLSGRQADFHYKNYYVFQNTSAHYVPVFRDAEKKLYVYSIPQRQKISFDIELILNTKMAALNTAVYLRERVLHKGYFYLNDVYLETEIPKNIIENLIEVNGFDVSTPEGNSEFMKYLNSNSQNSIVRKQKLSTGIYQYFYCFKINVLSIFPETPQIDDGEQDGQIDKDFKITTRLEFEFTCPFNYIFESGTNFNYKELDDEELLYLLEERFTISPTVPKPPVIQKEEKKEMKLVLWEGYVTESNIVDVVDISSVVGDDLLNVINYCNTNDKKLLDKIFKVELFVDKYKVPETDFNFNWDTLEVTTYKPEKDRTYFIGIYADIIECNIIFDKLDRRDLYITNELKIVK